MGARAAGARAPPRGLVPTLPGHAGGPPLPSERTARLLAHGVEQAMDDAGFGTAHLVGNSLGGYVALQLAARGRARTVVAVAPHGGWAEGDDSFRDILRLQASLHAQTKAAVPHADAILAPPDGRRRATRYITSDFAHIPRAFSYTSCSGWLTVTVRPR